jgi:DNA topoisomerase-3
LYIAQKLYADHTLITYPRAEAKYLPEANIKDVTQLVPALLSLSSYNGFQNLLKNPEIRKGKSGHFSDKALEGMSHYAIIPNVNTCANFVTSVRMLGADEAKLFDMIARQYMAALSPDFEYQQTTIEMIFPWKSHDWSFRTIGRIPLVPGWKEILSGSKSQDKDEVDLPVVKNGEQGLVEKAGLRTVTTRPPARYTEGSLIKVMQEVWRLVKDPDLRAKLKETRGIGTPATRAEVVKGLFKQGQIKLQGKSIVPTDGGMSLYKMLSEVSPNLLDPGRTAIWESLFEHVEKKRISAEDAVKKILSETQKEINNIVSKKGSLSISTGGGGSTRKPSAAMINAAKSIAESKSLKLPKAALSDFQTCSAFLSEHMEERKPGSEGVMLPSEKQVSYAKSLAEQTGLSLDPDILKDAKKTRDWIEKAAPKAPVRPPSEKQIAFAKSLSDSSGQPLPKNYDNDMKICSGFIEACLKSNPKKPSSGAKKNAFQPLPSLRP